MKHLFASLFGVLLLSGCASTYRQNITRPAQAKLQPGYSVAVHTPVNGSYGSQKYARSGSMTADALVQAFSRYSSNVFLVPVGSNLNNYSGTANIYYIQPEILHWEERATEWSGRPDRIEVKIDVIDAQTMTYISSVILTGKSKWMTLGGDHPQDLLPKPITDYVKVLYE